MTVTADTYSTISDAIAEGAVQESVAADSFNKSMFISNSVAIESQVWSDGEIGGIAIGC